MNDAIQELVALMREIDRRNEERMWQFSRKMDVTGYWMTVLTVLIALLLTASLLDPSYLCR